MARTRPLDALVDALPHLVWTATPDGLVEQVNQRWLELHGCAADQLLGRGWLEFVHPDERVECAARWSRGFAGHAAFEFELRMRRADGSYGWFQGRAVPPAPGGAPCWCGTFTESTAQRHAERELQMITRHLPASFSRVDRDLRYQFVSAGTSASFGRLGDMLVGRLLPELLGPQVFAQVDPHTRRALAGEQVSFELEVRRPAGTDLYCLLTLVPDLDPQGAVTGLFIFGLDVSARRHAELELRRSQHQLELVTNSLPGPVSRVDRELRYLFVNRRYEEAFGRPSAEVIGKRMPEVIGAELFAQVAPHVARVLAGETVVFESTFMSPSGGRVYTLTHYVPDRDRTGKVAGFFIVGFDIGPLKQAEAALQASEARYRTLIEEAPQAITVHRGGEICYANPAAVALLGGGSLAALIGRQIGSLLHPDSRRQLPRLMSGSVAGVTPDVELRFVQADGTPIDVHVRATGIELDGAPATHVAIEDITLRKVAEAEHARLEAQLQHAQKLESVGRLAGGVAHDFNNMLGVILGHTSLALDDLPPENPIRDDLEEVMKAARRSADLTRQLLAFARKQAITPKVIDLNTTVASMMSMLRRLIGEAITVHWAPSETLWPVRIDVSQVDQLLANLCVNARDAIAGVGTIKIATCNLTVDEGFCASHAEALPGEFVRLSLRDSGCGMDAATRTRVFEPFFTTKALGEGTGLGLAIVYGAVKQNGGFVLVDSTVGEGTTFEIFLPRHLGPAQPADASRDEAPRGTETILVVEDEPALLAFTSRALAAGGYKVLGTTKPHEALRIAHEHAGELHLVLSDVVMPEMNGNELTTTLQRRDPKLKRLFMSGYTAEILPAGAQASDPATFIAKPFSKALLLTTVRRVLDSRDE